ncbi:MAG TPA: nitrophenyl compound nitroreductase subunit ArsF family protein [Prolixibacteraceae bacterium]|nr:nitrophenyl compound nitroreductase subunit ArsF family protein [Prolixibacteraceae bacterium]
MKKVIFVSVILLFTGLSSVFAQCCSSAAAATAPCTEEVQQACTDVSNVEVIYFHATRRCATCNAVEEVTKEVLNDVYENKIKFTSIDREQDKKNKLIKKHKINGQTLLIIKGDKVVNLTNDAFMYARTNPEKLKEKLKETINSI